MSLWIELGMSCTKGGTLTNCATFDSAARKHWRACLLANAILAMYFYFQDLLRCRVLTSGIIETRFQVDKVKFQ